MKVTERQIEKALRKGMGFKTHAAQALGITLSAVCQRIKKSEHLQKVLREIEETNSDFVESKLYRLIHRDNPAAIFFYLKCKCKNRGYIERDKDQVEVTLRNTKYTTDMTQEQAEEIYKAFMNNSTAIEMKDSTIIDVEGSNSE